MVRVVVDELATWLFYEVVVLRIEFLEQVVEVVHIFQFHVHLSHVVNVMD